MKLSQLIKELQSIQNYAEAKGLNNIPVTVVANAFDKTKAAPFDAEPDVYDFLQHEADDISVFDVWTKDRDAAYVEIQATWDVTPEVDEDGCDEGGNPVVLH